MAMTKRIAIVTGVSREVGLGAAICRSLAHRGYSIYFTYDQAYDALMPWGKDEDFPARFAHYFDELGTIYAHRALDLADPKAITLLYDDVEKTLGKPSVLINNATYSTQDGYQALDAVTLDRHYAVNVRATCLLAVELAKRWSVSQQHGRVINIISGQDKGPMVGEIAYATTKGAITAFTQTFAAEVAHLGITVNAVDPGPTDTGWMTQEVKRDLAARSPLSRVGQPEDVTGLINFLASEDAYFVTGQIIHSDGGFW